MSSTFFYFYTQEPQYNPLLESSQEISILSTVLTMNMVSQQKMHKESLTSVVITDFLQQISIFVAEKFQTLKPSI